MYQDYEHKRRKTVADKSLTVFWNTAILCGTAILIAVTTKVIMSIFM